MKDINNSLFHNLSEFLAPTRDWPLMAKKSELQVSPPNRFIVITLGILNFFL
jgi:hypothetical protein